MQLRYWIVLELAVASVWVGTTPIAAVVNAPEKPQAFAARVAQNTAAAIALSRLATEHTQDSELKSFAVRMVTDHTKLHLQLAALASRKSWRLPAGMDMAHTATVKRLERLYGTAFDREYITAMVDDHDRAVSWFQVHARSGADADLREWAAKVLPLIEDHRRMAHETGEKFGRAASR
jgi:putative membrane protein